MAGQCRWTEHLAQQKNAGSAGARFGKWAACVEAELAQIAVVQRFMIGFVPKNETAPPTRRRSRRGSTGEESVASIAAILGRDGAGTACQSGHSPGLPSAGRTIWCTQDEPGLDRWDKQNVDHAEDHAENDQQADDVENLFIAGQFLAGHW